MGQTRCWYELASGLPKRTIIHHTFNISASSLFTSEICVVGRELPGRLARPCAGECLHPVRASLQARCSSQRGPGER